MRLAAIRSELDAIIRRLKPEVVVVEQAFASLNIQSALRIGEGRGVVLACAAGYGAEVVQYPPASARKTLLGNGSAGKQQANPFTRALPHRESTTTPRNCGPL